MHLFTFWLLAIINLFVGGMIGLERTIVPLLGEKEFALEAGSAVATFILSFSLSKAIVNLFAGFLADTFGRKRILIAGWLFALPVAPLLIWAPSWSWIVFANCLLGINQALSWSMTVNMMVDLVPSHRRGFAVGLNEFCGYLGLSLLAFLTGLVASEFSLRPEPFFLGIAVSLVGLFLSFAVKETFVAKKSAPIAWVQGVGLPSLLGCATNFKDGLVWLSLPLMLSKQGFSLTQVAAVVGLYPLVWAIGQLFFGPLSDRIGRRTLIAAGMFFQGLGLIVLVFGKSFALVLLAAILLGLGTAMVYPTLIASVADRVSDEKRASALGIYRFFRDGGYGLGAVIVGLSFSVVFPAILVIAVIMIVLAVVAFIAL